MLKAFELFELATFRHAGIFSNNNVWTTIPRIKEYLQDTIKPNIPDLDDCMVARTFAIHESRILSGKVRFSGAATKGELKVLVDGKEYPGASVVCAGAIIMSSDIEIGHGSIIESGAYIKGPTIIGSNCEVRQSAYMRGSCLIGDMAVVGHATEVKNAIMMDGAKAGHFAYVGDSILGNNTNLGAGTKLANLKMKGSTISLGINGSKVDTGLRKMGAILGDNVETGCNTVTNPGVILGKGSLVYPNSSVKSNYYKGRQIIR